MIQIAKQDGLIAGLVDHIIEGGCAVLQIQFFLFKMIWRVPEI
jgi:hypothetical protein